MAYSTDCHDSSCELVESVFWDSDWYAPEEADADAEEVSE